MAALGGLFDAKLLLPNLQSLSAHALTITEIATLFPDTLSRVIELSFGVGAEDHARDSLVDMVLALRKIDGLPLLKKLKYIEGESMKDDLDGFIEVMEGMGAVVTGLNIWESDMPEGLNLVRPDFSHPVGSCPSCDAFFLTETVGRTILEDKRCSSDKGSLFMGSIQYAACGYCSSFGISLSTSRVIFLDPKRCDVWRVL